MVIWTLAKKDLRLLVRDARALIILLAMPVIFILVLGVSLGDNFGQKPLQGLKVSVLDEDEGLPRFFDRPAMMREGFSWFAATPNAALGPQTALAASSLAHVNSLAWFPHERWSDVLIRDLNETADIRVEKVKDRAEAEQLVRSGKRAAVLILGKRYSKRVERCSFLASGWSDGFNGLAVYTHDPISIALRGLFDESQGALPLYFQDGINPFYRDGINLQVLDVTVLRDETQHTAAAIIDQVAQGSHLRVIMPWMIGRAFEKIGEEQFIDMVSREKLDVKFNVVFTSVELTTILRGFSSAQKKALASGMQDSLQKLYPRYNLTAKTWAALTKENEVTTDKWKMNTEYKEDGSGWLKRGGTRYQLLVPSSLVMFAFFLVLTGGWLFVAERRQGTLKRLVVAPLTKGQILIGKMLPCLLVSLFQGYFLLGAGKLLFDMSWGPQPAWLIAVVAATSLAAMGLAMVIAVLARTESQVAIYGTLLLLLLAGLMVALVGGPSTLPEQLQRISRFTPHAWALDAYRQLLTTSAPNIAIVAEACGVLCAFGVGFTALAWLLLRLDADA